MTTVGEEIRRLERYVARGDAQRALEGYESLLAQMPRDPVLRSRVGFLRNLLHRHAPDWQVRTYVISPRAVAEAHVMGERYAEALEILEGLLELDPNDTGLARRVAMVRALRDGNEDDGLEPTASTHIMSPEMLVEAHLAAGEVESALKLLRRLAERRPDDTRLQRRIVALTAAWDGSSDDDQTSVTQVQVPSPHAPPDAPPPLPGNGLARGAVTQPSSPGAIAAAGQDSADLPTIDDLPALPDRDARAAPTPVQDLDDEDDARYDTAVLAGLMENARAVIREHAPTPPQPPPRIVEAEPPAAVPSTAVPPAREPLSTPAQPPAPAPRPPLPPPRRPGARIRPTAGPEPRDNLASGRFHLPQGSVRAVRRQLSPARAGRDSVDDLISGDPHKSLDGKLLGIPEGQIEGGRSAEWDIHEMLTETGTKPGVKLPAAPPVSPDRPFEPARSELPPVSPPRPPRRPRIPAGTVDYEDMARFARPSEPPLPLAGEAALADPEDFNDESTMAEVDLEAAMPSTLPEKRLPGTEVESAPAPPAPLQQARPSDLFDDADEPTLLEPSPLQQPDDFTDGDDDATLAHQDPRRPLAPPTRRGKK